MTGLGFCTFQSFSWSSFSCLIPPKFRSVLANLKASLLSTYHPQVSWASLLACPSAAPLVTSKACVWLGLSLRQWLGEKRPWCLQDQGGVDWAERWEGGGIAVEPGPLFLCAHCQFFLFTFSISLLLPCNLPPWTLPADQHFLHLSFGAN